MHIALHMERRFSFGKHFRRTTIFALRGPLGPGTGSVRARLLEVAAEVGPLLGCEPQLRFRGPIDAVVPEPVVDDLVAVLREALTNTARHAGATHVEVEVAASTSELSLVVADDGTGLHGATRRSGLANLRDRAELHGGHMELSVATTPTTRPDHEGTRLTWTIPLT